jgi:hypothetical protein
VLELDARRSFNLVGRIRMLRIAIALENGNPFAYLLIFILLLPPVFICISAIIEKIAEVYARRKHDRKRFD